MKLSFTTSPQGVEAANCLLRIAIDNLSQNEDLAKQHGVEPIHIYEAIIFRKKMIRAHLRIGKLPRKTNKKIMK